MGIYLEVPEKKDKAHQMETLHGAEVIEAPNTLNEVPEGHVLLCVVENSMFDAVGVVEDEKRLFEFSNPLDTRPKTWMILPYEKAVELNPMVAQL